MRITRPPKLQSGDEIRVISPAQSIEILSPENQHYAIKQLESLGLKISFGKHVNECDMFNSSSVESRIKDLHDAFSDKNVKGILTVIGGFNSNQLLEYIDYNLIKNNPKILCGFSDITALGNAIYAKTGLITYSGLQFSSFAMQKGNSFSIEYFKKMLFNKTSFEIPPSEEWSDDKWFKNQNNREFINNEGYWIINEGAAEGKILGGNLCTFQLLHGTTFMPDLKDSIIFAEDDAYTNGCDDVEFDRNLQSLIQQPNFNHVKALIIGRFQKASKMSFKKLEYIIRTKKELDNIPVIANADFGHTTPIFTFPIGSKANLIAKNKEVQLQISED